MVEFKEKYLHTDGKKIQILSGAIHYFRTLPEQWEDRLVKLKNLGFNTVETYCCWNLHEPRENEFCFEGIPQGSTVAVSTVGVLRDKTAREIWRQGTDEMMRRIQPQTVILYGKAIDYDWGKTKVVSYQPKAFAQ